MGPHPPWSKAVPNARAETVATTPWIRDAFKKRYCQMPAAGFYGWAGAKRKKKPYLFRLKGARLFAFEGLLDRRDGLNSSEVVAGHRPAFRNAEAARRGGGPSRSRPSR